MQRVGVEMRKVFQGDKGMCKGPEATSACMLRELIEDQAGALWRRALRRESWLRGQWRPSGNSHIKGGWSHARFWRWD